MFKTLRSRVIASYFVVVTICLVLASIFFTIFLSNYIRNREREDLRRQVGAVANEVARVTELVPLLVPPGSARPAGIRHHRLPYRRPGSRDTQLRIRGAQRQAPAGDARGAVVSEARRRPLLGEGRIRIPADLLTGGGGGATIREQFLQSLGREYLVASAPTMTSPTSRGFLLAIKPAEEITGATPTLIVYVVLAGVSALIISMLLALYLSGALSKPVRAVAAAARNMAEGDYEQQVAVKGPVETAELASDFNLMAERVRNAYERQRTFAANVSHELRTPLTSIEGFSQALLDGVSRSEDEQKRSLQIINEESKRLGRVTRDILLLSQIDAGELQPEMVSLDVVELLRKARSLYGPVAEEGGVEIRFDAPAPPVTLNTDPDRVERILTNLLDNALKYTGRGGAVTLSVETEPGAVRISVADTGPGIEPEVLPRIFDRFYRANGEGGAARSGAGLGARHLQGAGRDARWRHRGREQARGGDHFHGDPPALASAISCIIHRRA